VTQEENMQKAGYRKVELTGAKTVEETWKGAMVDQSLQRLIQNPPPSGSSVPAPATKTVKAQADGAEPQ